MLDSLLKAVAVVFIFAFRSAFKLAWYAVAHLVSGRAESPNSSPTLPTQVTASRAPVKQQESAPVEPPAKTVAHRPLSPLGKRTISERPASDPEVLFAYATARRGGLVGRDDAVGKAQLLALPARMAVQWRRFQPLRVEDPKYRLHAVGKKSVLAIDTSDMTPEGLEEVYQAEVRDWRPSPANTPPATWVDHAAMIYPQVVIHEHLARQLRLELPTWKPLQEARPVTPTEILKADNRYWVISARDRRPYDPPSGMLLS